ncbi:MAG: hypothetical protein JWR33_50 [Naasia sp.]|uniref:protealysin inhibitor emfourin n=1 Tax=Naasia sp. TaxID=2546198 RepID=UPI00260F7AF3|nr:protealysin inhibitor emfourin [Naasia sp.]MCU1569309.1 hypothetical protein [Naasia sp.]
MISVTITRSGGVAGLSRSWHLLLEHEEWRRLCSRTPMDEEPPRDRDRYTYRIRARDEVLVIPESRWDDGWRGLLERARPGEPGEEAVDDPPEDPTAAPLP